MKDQKSPFNFTCPCPFCFSGFACLSLNLHICNFRYFANKTFIGPRRDLGHSHLYSCLSCLYESYNCFHSQKPLSSFLKSFLSNYVISLNLIQQPQLSRTKTEIKVNKIFWIYFQVSPFGSHSEQYESIIFTNVISSSSLEIRFKCQVNQHWQQDAIILNTSCYVEHPIIG